jgi:ferredoxin
MTDKVILKSKTGEFLSSLMGKYAVVAPMPRKDAPAEFREIKAGDEPILDGSQPMMPPKDWLLPRYEVLLRASTRKGEAKVEATVPESKPTVLLGAWLADTQAIKVLDRVYLDGKFKDPYYAARRENTLLVAVMPTEPRWSWFCSAVDDVETWKQNVDAIVYDLGDRFYVEVTSDKGEALIDGGAFSDPSDADTAARDEVWTRFVEGGKLPFADEKLYERLAWENPVWEEIATKCISCGMCSYMCPSCSCFDIQDETCGDCTERYRCRDTCQFEDFTLMGAGHNPRHNQVPRSRQRLLHKFQYQHDQYGIVGCTGCGRCVELCPVNVDIRDVLTRVCAAKEPVES